ncbi:substrate-binding domain-containing protein [Methylobacterium sp. J-030]|uniref:substrate-binding domain-containing protein n=1 Tax=Methylobacterium sp. J-030 TaxID=2836627 RepID=UPI001FB8F01E|nr:substrate-binding domain-containing protein [Methylobacterium sp. J-030]
MINLMASLALILAPWPSQASEALTVLMSGGFSLAYRAVIPDFERDTGISVTTLSGASQGTGPQTVKSQLERGVRADVVILSENGLDELITAGLVLHGTAAGLARVPLGAAVRQGSPKPDVATLDALKRTLLAARLLVMPGSTSGLFMKTTVLPKLAIGDRVASKLVPRGLDATRMLAAGEADLAIGPLSELVDQPGVSLVGPLPEEVQLVQVFTGAIVATSPHVAEGKRLIAFLASERAAAAIRKAGMEPGGALRAR